MSVINATPLLAAAGGDYQISRSVRLRSSASAYFNRTPASAGNRKTWTWSGWVKRGSLGVSQYLFSAGTGGTDVTQNGLNFQADDTLRWTGAATVYRQSTQVFRDPSAWYHIVLQFDTTLATANDRIRLYVNNVQITAFGTLNNPTQNLDYAVNQAAAHEIGRWTGASNPFDGYLTEVNFIDGQALTPSSFGETDSITGVWKPKKYTGTYGTNGFYLNFSDNSAATAAAIGKDYSGNGNNWTPNNISLTAGATYDSMLDVPTLYADGGNGRGNYATLNPIVESSGSPAGYVDGNLKANGTASTQKYGYVTIRPNGKFYAEFAPFNVPSDTANFVGISSPFARYYASNGQVYNGSSWVSYGATYSAGDTIGMAIDTTAGTLEFFKNNTSQGQLTGLTTGEASILLSMGIAGGVAGWNANFGQRPFAYTPPTGFKALNTQNLPEPTIKKGNQYFDATTYTGTGSVQSVVNSGGFQPDFVWIKGRSTAYNHHLFDSVRGATLALFSNLTNAEATNGLTAFDGGGFSLSGSYSGVNANAATYVGWQWKESPSAGFDIVTYTGTGAAQTVAHNLGVAPKMIIIKSRSGVRNWPIYNAYLTNPATAYLILNATSAQTTGDTTVWGSTAPTSSVFTVGTAGSTNNTSETYVAYLFAEVAGFSKFGSYVGNGSSTDGPFVYCGFRPRWVMIKQTSGASDWIILDTSRDPYNMEINYLVPNTSGAEASGASVQLDGVSNGIKIRGNWAGMNASGSTYIFAAFAETPFKNSLAR